jgi:BAI1-associated protein 3
MQKESNSDNLDSSLTIFCCFINDTLKIEILNARNLPVNELNKKCDSYVKVRLVPEQKFPNFHNFKTKVQCNTIFPLYEESFQTSLTKEQQNLKDAIISFTVKEKNLVTGDACIAETFLLFEDIPQVTSLDKLQQTRLKLSKLQNNGKLGTELAEHHF